MESFLLLALTAEHLSPIAANAEISEEIHKRYVDARDYSGCVKTNLSSSLKVKTEIANNAIGSRDGFIYRHYIE